MVNFYILLINGLKIRLEICEIRMKISQNNKSGFRSTIVIFPRIMRFDCSHVDMED